MGYTNLAPTLTPEATAKDLFDPRRQFLKELDKDLKPQTSPSVTDLIELSKIKPEAVNDLKKVLMSMLDTNKPDRFYKDENGNEVMETPGTPGLNKFAYRGYEYEQYRYIAPHPVDKQRQGSPEDKVEDKLKNRQHFDALQDSMQETLKQLELIKKNGNKSEDVDFVISGIKALDIQLEKLRVMNASVLKTMKEHDDKSIVGKLFDSEFDEKLKRGSDGIEEVKKEIYDICKKLTDDAKLEIVVNELAKIQRNAESGLPQQYR